MLYFNCDYMEGAHPKILKRLQETNLEQTVGYGEDPYCESAKKKIRKACGFPEAAVFFLIGGTQTNAAVIKSMLRPYEGVIAAESGHINVHEAGAIETGGHKVLALPASLGKLEAGTLCRYLEGFFRDPSASHMVQPGMVYISHPTEYGTLYAPEELKALRAVCTRYGLPLYLDGARLGYGLAAGEGVLTLPQIAECCDAFYIGGTKVGALFGEAVVFPRTAPKGFFTLMKQQGAVLAKGRLLGLQFDTLFTDGLYLRISAHAIEMAMRLKEILTGAGCPLWLDSPTNQQFVILDSGKRAALAGKVGYEVWEEREDGSAVARFAASWATKEEDLLALQEALSSVRGS